MELSLIQNFLDQAVEDKLIPGACFAYVDLFEKHFICSGYRQIVPTLELNTLDTLYDLASCTKVVATTTAILLLLEQERLTLDTKVSFILPRYKYKNITIKDLLTHTSGMPNSDNNYKNNHTKESFVDYIYNLELEYEPNTKVQYTDFNFILLGFVIEEITKMSIDQFTSKFIFEPLQMKSTRYLGLNGNPERCASTEVTAHRGVIKGIVHDGKAYLLEGKSGNAGVFSNVDDLSNFVEMMLNQGLFRGHRFLRQDTIGLLRHCFTEGLNFRRTLGWLNDEPSSPLGDYYSNDMIFHTGFTGTSIYIDFKRQCGIILLTNRIHPNRDNAHIDQIRKEVMNLVLYNR